MPHLQFDIGKMLSEKQKNEFIFFVRSKFSEIMKTGTDHIAISIRVNENNKYSLGRTDIDENVCLMNLDIRSGRSYEQKRKLALHYMNATEKILGIKKKNQYLTFTEHKGEDFHLIEKCLENWKKNDDPLKKNSCS